MMFLQVMRSKYDQFGGRAGRREFWLFWLVHVILSVIAGVIDRLIFGELEGVETGAISGIYWLISIVPVLALGARRLHDSGRTGWYQSLMVFWIPTAVFGAVAAGFGQIGADVETAVTGTLALVFFIVALVGTVILFVFAVLPGDEDDNQYGQPGMSPDRPAVYWTVLTTRYAMFAGRAGRREFWLFALVNSLVVPGVASRLDQWLLPGLVSDQGAGVLVTIYMLATIVAALAIGARRLHDTGRSGWWQLLLIPPVIIVGWIVLLVFFVMPSQEGENKHGEPAIAPE